MDNQKESGQLLDTTDCLEAVGVFRGWKNFLFVIVFLCLLVLQVAFWLVNADVVATGDDPNAPAVATEPAEPQAEPLAGIVRGPDLAAAPQDPNAPRDVEIIINAHPDPAEEVSEPRHAPLEALTFGRLALAIRVTNAVLIVSAAVYFLTILFCLKISLVARLGGINHICRAFFLALIMVVLLLPWQMLFGRVAIGAIFLPKELLAWSDIDTSNTFRMVLYFLRFVGYWLLVFLLLISAQIRTSRWTRSILRRLEVI